MQESNVSLNKVIAVIEIGRKEKILLGMEGWLISVAIDIL